VRESSIRRRLHKADHRVCQPVGAVNRIGQVIELRRIFVSRDMKK